MIKVIVRDSGHSEGTELGKFKPSQIPSLVELFKCYYTYTDGETGDGNCTLVLARFMAPENEQAYFELVVEDDE